MASIPSRAECALAIFKDGLIDQDAMARPLDGDDDWITLATFNVNQAAESVLKLMKVSTYGIEHTMADVLRNKAIPNRRWPSCQYNALLHTTYEITHTSVRGAMVDTFNSYIGKKAAAVGLNLHDRF